jgi:glyoxylase-like metal-dependent hydrolase (beta-lactamase superfamily II)
MLTLDLKFQGIPGAIASYLLPHRNGVALIESGPGSTIPALLAELHRHGYTVKDISAVFVTHIHLDHAGAAGWLAHQGAQIYVHPIGAPHLLDPEKLLSSARRIYGEQMDTLWGEFLAVPAERLTVIEDNEVVEIDGLRLRALDTPGHANHHHVYIHDDIAFTGDIGGVRMPGTRCISLPMPPPEFILEKWYESLARLIDEFAQGSFTRLAPTHFGAFQDPAWHLAALGKALDEMKAWIEATLPVTPDDEALMEKYLKFVDRRFDQNELQESQRLAYEAANPSFMSVTGIRRYWKKYRLPA